MKVDGRKKKGVQINITEDDIGRYAQIRDAQGFSGWWEILKLENEKVYCKVNSLYTDWEDKQVPFTPKQVVQLVDDKPETTREKTRKKRYKLRANTDGMSLKELEELRKEQQALDLPAEVLHPDHPLNTTRLSHIPINPILDIMGMYSPNEYATIQDIENITGVPKRSIRHYIYSVDDNNPNKLRPDKVVPVLPPKEGDKLMTRQEMLNGEPIEGKYFHWQKSPVIQSTDGRLYFRWKKVWWWYYNRKTPGRNNVSRKAQVDIKEILGD